MKKYLYILENKLLSSRKWIDRVEALARMVGDVFLIVALWQVWNRMFVDIMSIQSITFWQAFIIVLMIRWLVHDD